MYSSLAVAVQANAGMAVPFTQNAHGGHVLGGCLLTVLKRCYVFDKFTF